LTKERLGKIMFNHQARWDRELPFRKQDKYGIPIAVTCVMEKGRITPKSFLWKNKEVEVTKINFFWKDSQGKKELVFFSVQTPCGHYQIVMCPSSLTWHLVKLLGP